MNRMPPILALASALALAACAPSAPPAEQDSGVLAPPAVTPETTVPETGDVRPAQADMVGQFGGTLPCASCPGIDTRLTLSADGSYLLEETYREQADGSFSSQGHWSMGDQGHISLAPESADDTPRVYRVDDADTLRQLGEGDIDPGEEYTLRRG